MNRYLELNSDNTVVNIIVWDGVSEYKPDGLTLLLLDEHPDATFGWTLVDGKWVAPAADPEADA